MSVMIEIIERIYYDEKGQPTRWVRSLDHGKTWENVDCSLYPDGRPPFVFFNPPTNLAYVEQRTFADGEA